MRHLPFHSSVDFLDDDPFQIPARVFPFVIMPNVDFRDVVTKASGNTEIAILQYN